MAISYGSDVYNDVKNEVLISNISDGLCAFDNV